MERRIDDHKIKNKNLDSEIQDLKEQIILKIGGIEAAEERLNYLKNIPKENVDERREKSERQKHAKFNVFVDFLSEKFKQLKEELDNLWLISGREKMDQALPERLKIFLDCLSDINTNLQDFKL